MGLVDWESFEPPAWTILWLNIFETLVVHEVMLKKKEQRNPLLARVSLINSLKLKYENKVNSVLKLD